MMELGQRGHGIFGRAEPELELGRMDGPNAPLPAPSWKGRVLGGVFFLAALVCVGFSVYNAAHAGGLAGRHGTLTVQRCWVEQGTRNSSDTTVCSGSFRPEDDSAVVRDAELRREHRPGAEVPVQQTGSGYLASGLAETWRWNALFFIAWIVAALGVPFAATGIFPARTQAFAVGARVRGTRAAVVMKYLYIGGAAGTAVCLYLTWIL
ncbi:MAG: hypothetical protein ACRDP3_04315 [Streptomyces sp.]|uniref:hypothetical protein n=1 Tax=Streptomyces sp. TaxID=1931 RepID=UPI003D6A8CDE